MATEDLTQTEVDASQNGAGGLEGEEPGEQGGGEVELIIEGDGQLSLRVGGKKPDKATAKLSARSIGIPDGVFDKGDMVRLLLTTTVQEVHFIDKRQGSTGEIIETERRHILVITGAERIKE